MKPGIKWTLPLLGVILIVSIFRGCVMTSFLIPSTGMENSLFQGERILVNKWSYGLRLPFISLLGYQRWKDRPINKEDIFVFNNPGNFSEPTIDHREVFIGRCIGTPGETLWVDSLFTVITSGTIAPDQKFLYTYPCQKEKEVEALLSILSIPDNRLMGQDSTKNVRSFSRYEYYLLEQAIDEECWIELFNKQDSTENLYPLVIPKKRKSIQVHPWNATLLRNTLVLHENQSAEVKNDTLYIKGKPVEYCTFTKDYYWVGANNSVNLADSRLFGFVPKDHVIGKASFIWYSKEDKGWFKGYRWKRIFSAVK